MRAKNLLFIITILIFSTLAAKAQRVVFDIDELGIFPEGAVQASAKVACDPALKSIESGLVSAGKKRQAYGYSVQIFFESGVDAQKKAEKIAQKFSLDTKSKEEAYVFYEAPYFKVRAGDCRTRLEATRLKKNIEAKFPGCFIIECKISYPKL
ncbi:MAG: SPOR domain-containing protein [Bacteroidales bacterium]|nr:SPOR domain-containing protein [Bacteroidales bacterium]